MTVKTSFMQHIRFPVRDDNSFCHGQGQNGRVLMSGLSLSAPAGSLFASLHPLTSRGLASKSAGFDIAYDKQTLTALADLAHAYSQSAESMDNELAAGRAPTMPAVYEVDVPYPAVAPGAFRPMSRGRYKRSYVSALQLSIRADMKVVTIRPYNSLAKLTPYCWLEVAYDAVTLQALADAFLALAGDAP